MKELVFTWFFKNETVETFKTKCRDFSLTVIPQLVKTSALQTLKKHIDEGDKVIIVSASFEEYLCTWCNSMNLELIGTKIIIRDGIVTGKIDGQNCYGVEKVNRLNQYLDLHQFNEIYAYGDSQGDLPMLEIANHRFYKYFN
jgi:phosphatidylglycerophosphatase C